jgi:hypothetical protein
LAQEIVTVGIFATISFDWEKFGNQYGFPALVLGLIGFIVWLYFIRIYLPKRRAMDELEIKEKAQSIETLKMLTKTMPELQAAGNRTIEQVKSLHKRHDVTHEKIDKIDGRVASIEKTIK